MNTHISPELNLSSFSGAPLRIANFSFSYAPFMTGISAGVHDRIAQLLEWGHTVRLFRPDVDPSIQDVTPSPEMYGLHNLECYPSFSDRPFPTKRHLFRPSHPEARHHREWSDTELLEEFQPDIVLVDEAMGLYGFSSMCIGGYKKPIGVEYGKRTGVPVVNLLQTDWLGYVEQNFGRVVYLGISSYLKKWVSEFVKAYPCNLAPSRFLKDRVNGYVGGDDVDHCHFWGVDGEQFRPENIAFDPIPEIDSPVILFTGRVAHEKSVCQLMDAFEEVHRHVPEARLYLLGSGPLVKSLRRRAKREFGESVQIPGPVFGNSLKGWYARAQVYWTASVTENFSTSILEALVSGTPVVAAARGGNVEQFQDGVSGYLVAPDDPQEMAQRTIQLLSDPDLLLEMSTQARLAGMEFDNSVSCERLLRYISREFEEGCQPAAQQEIEQLVGGAVEQS